MGIARTVLAAAWLNCGLLTAAEAGPGPGGDGQWLRDGSCALFEADAHPGDTVRWTGDCAGGYAEGLGTATFTHDGQEQSFTAYFSHGTVPDGPVVSRWGHGWRYSGDAVGGRFNGFGTLVTDTSDRLDGRWVDGKLSGFGVLLRANGERYAGDWQNDKPNGNGELRHADGTVEHGIFQDGRLVKDEAPATARLSGDEKVEGPFGSIAGKTLLGVDGSSIALTLIDGGMVLEVVPADGIARKTTFAFMNDRMGTVVDDSGGRSSNVTGFFRLTGAGIEVRYADGHSAMLSANAEGGVQMALDGASGTACSAWYPQGHVFSDADKRLALNAYASKLGLPAAASDSGNGCSVPHTANIVPSIAPSAPMARPERHAAAKTPTRVASYHIGDYQPAKAPEPVGVKNSEIHLIDGDTASPTAP